MSLGLGLVVTCWRDKVPIHMCVYKHTYCTTEGQGGGLRLGFLRE